jgi:hypothetical protein
MVSRIEFLTLITNKIHELSKETNDQSETEYETFCLDEADDFNRTRG